MAEKAISVPLTKATPANADRLLGTDSIDSSTKNFTILSIRQDRRSTPGAQGFNIVQGHPENAIDPAGDASTISGGGIAGSPNTIDVGGFNTIGGGYDNKITTTGIGANEIAGGAHNRIEGTADHGFIGGGSYNKVNLDTNYGTVVAGTGNTASDDNALVGGGNGNTASGHSALVVGGLTNTATGLRASVLGGTLNDATGSDASVGGGNTNKARGTGATIGGGFQGEAGSAATPANGNYATVGGGFQNKIGTTAQAQYGTVAGGRANTVNADYGTATGGRENAVSAAYGVASGYGAKADKIGQQAHAQGFFVAAGDAQTSTIVLRRQVTLALATELRTDTGAGRVTMADDTTWMFTVFLVARRTDTDNESAAYKLEGCIDRNAGVVALVGAVTKTVIAEDTAAWDCAAVADDVNKALSITFTGEAGKTINVVARVTLVEVTG